ncbi:phosphonate metabolism protein/1,5-bisphosphokinase (PRPP-forming) PhnN [Pseudonocardia sp.]|uniref:phosphonate metabolism protein/1,5-bisphosphokinase (PRPP-forming) PhnN n=1 Tax=Pseudonocardia sp. TaxID=60912 RepID=UPI0031FE0231
MTARIGPGAFVAVVGASGVGKDALISGARAHCGRAAHFPRRVITRPPGPGEDFDSLSEAAFLDAEERGDFAVSWRAHGLAYGIPVWVDEPVRAGEVVVANVSRGAVSALEERYDHVVVVRVTVSDAVRAARLRARCRESVDAIARRLARVDPAPERVADHEIRNDATVAEGSAQLLAIVTAALATTRRPGERV